MRRPALAALAALLLAAVTACTSDKTPTPSPTARYTAASFCLPPDAGTAVYFDGLAGRLFGHGEVGMVFGHEADGGACDWIPQARQYADQGYLTLAIDFDGYGASLDTGGDYPADIDAAVAYLASKGATKVVLIGSSMGGSSVLAAVPGSSLPVACVIALSPPSAFGGADAIGAVGRVTVPTLIGVGRDDSVFPDSQQLYAASASAHKKLVVEETGAHGHALLGMPEISAAIADYLTAYAPPA